MSKAHLLLAAAGLAASATSALAADPYTADEVMVRMRSAATLPALLAQHQLTLRSQLGSRPIYRLGIASGASVSATVAALRADPGVHTAEPNRQLRGPEARKNAVWAIGQASDYTAQWAPEALRLPQAHALTQGAGVRVAVLDTGVDATHPALAGRILPGRDFVDGDLDPSEEGGPTDAAWGHGTHVAGLVALAAPAAQIVPLRVLDPAGQGSTSTVAEALVYATDPDGNPATADGAHVVNLSLGTLDRNDLLEAVVQLVTCSSEMRLAVNDFSDSGYDGDKARCAARGSGAVVVAAAGNGGNRKERQYPAAAGVYGLLPVAASREDERLATFSNSGSWVDVAAPGEGITSALPGSAWGVWSGTSMAAPLAAGVAALVRADSPLMRPVDVTKTLERYGMELCGDTNIVQLDAYAALTRRQPPDACP